MLPDDLKEVLRGHGAESFTASHAMELRRIEDHVARQALTKTVIDQGYNYQQTKEAVEHELHPFAEPAYPSAAYEESSEEAGEERIVIPTAEKLKGHEVARGVALLRKKSEQLLALAQQLASDERIDHADLRIALDQLYVKLAELAVEIS